MKTPHRAVNDLGLAPIGPDGSPLHVIDGPDEAWQELLVALAQTLTDKPVTGFRDGCDVINTTGFRSL